MATSPTVLITGGSSGIGKEIAKRYFKEGYNLVVVSLLEDELSQLKDELKETLKAELKAELSNKATSQTVDTLALDLTEEDAPEQVLAFCDSRQLTIDILINNAGFGLHSKHIELNAKQLNSMLKLNIIAVSGLCHVFANRMKANTSSHKHPAGTIINIGSTSAFQPLPKLAAYAASKAFVVSFTEALATELAEHGINVHCVCPGTTKTPFLDVAGLSESKEFGSTAYIAHKVAMSPEKVADLVYDIVGTKQTTAVPGLVNKLHFQLTHWLPSSIIQPVVNGFLNRKA